MGFAKSSTHPTHSPTGSIREESPSPEAFGFDLLPQAGRGNPSGEAIRLKAIQF
jgi:hypothetical protein